MSKSCHKQMTAATSATVLTLSLVFCLGAAESRAVMAMRAVESSERTTLTAGQRQALASLLARLTDAARQLHQSPQAAVAHHTVTRPAPIHIAPALAYQWRPLDRPQSPPTPPLRAALRNLPPPAVR